MLRPPDTVTEANKVTNGQVERRVKEGQTLQGIANSPLQSLTFLYPSLYLSVGDLVCLGDCVRRSKHLTRLKLPNLKSIESYMPILLAVGGSNAIQTLRIDSNTVSVWDKAFQLAVTSLRHNSTLRTLSLAHWTFDLQVRCESVRKSV
ncbi:hypothetical protein Pcinc_026747 [Petrolisthes cinctipes]|uniref:Uncharacterized protein n=1 Tax=Petrolisthes cinctipes TaxID=88211 RepID=A0AAE1F5V8_PETCI|nr:hypothetical protein Pcinc_026747 [Petrolisthes cinctipes]